MQIQAQLAEGFLTRTCGEPYNRYNHTDTMFNLVMQSLSKITKRILLLCLFILLASLLGHLVIDMAGAAAGISDILHHHNELALHPILGVVILLLIISRIFATHAEPTHWLQPPTTPPPIPVCL